MILHCIPLATAVHASLPEQPLGWGTCHSKVSKNLPLLLMFVQKSKRLSSWILFFIPALLVSNDKFLEQIQYIYTCCLILYNTQFAFTNSSFFSQGGDDFVSQQFTLTFPAGQTRAEFTVAITDDSLIEAMESFQLLLSIPEDLISKGVQVGPKSAATVTIMDNDGELNGINWTMVAPYVYMNA